MQKKGIASPSSFNVASCDDNSALRVSGYIIVVIEEFLHARVTCLAGLQKNIFIFGLTDAFKNQNEMAGVWVLQATKRLNFETVVPAFDRDRVPVFRSCKRSIWPDLIEGDVPRPANRDSKESLISVYPKVSLAGAVFGHLGD